MQNPEQAIQQCIHRRDLENAWRCCQSWLQQSPKDPAAWRHAAIVSEMSGNIHKANLCIETALELDPDSISANALRAKLLTDKRAISEISCHALSRAKAIADRYTCTAIQDPNILRIFSAVYRHAGDFARAIKWQERAVLLDPLSAQTENDLGVLYQLFNRRIDARRHLERALELKPENFMAYWQIAQLDPDDSEQMLGNMRSVLKRNAGVVEAEIYLGFALARLEERRKNYPVAFAQLSAANAAVKTLHPYNVETDEAYFLQLEQAYPRTLFPGTDKSTGPGPIFVLGLPRTGTTLVEQLICASDQVTAAGELLNFSTLAEAALRSASAGQNGGALREKIAALDHELIGKLYLHSCEPLRSDTPYFVDKYPFNFAWLGEIALSLPTARIVHVERNPMDACFSNYKHLFRLGSASHSYDLEDLGRYFLAYKRLMKHWQQCLPGRLYTVSYDHLVRAPQEQAREMMDFLSLPWNDDYLNFHRSRDAVATPSAAQVRRTIYSSSSQHWRHYRQELAALSEFFRAKGVEIPAG